MSLHLSKCYIVTAHIVLPIIVSVHDILVLIAMRAAKALVRLRIRL